MFHGARNVYHGVVEVLYGARKVSYGARKVSCDCLLSTIYILQLPSKMSQPLMVDITKRVDFLNMKGIQ